MLSSIVSHGIDNGLVRTRQLKPAEIIGIWLRKVSTGGVQWLCSINILDNSCAHNYIFSGSAQLQHI